MRKIYIVLTCTNTFLSYIVKGYTRKKYSHVSIALDKNLNEMYSFGRLNAYNPFIGGFVQESPDYGTFKRFHNTKTKIFSLDVTDEQYNQIKNNIKKIYLDKDSYRFNTIGLFCVALHKRIHREKCFYCAEFVKYIFEQSNLEIDLPELIKPEDFANLEGAEEIYTGILREYHKVSCFDNF